MLPNMFFITCRNTVYVHLMYWKVSAILKKVQCITFLVEVPSSACLHREVIDLPRSYRPDLWRGHTKVGYALYYFSYRSFRGRAVFMEDLYVMPEFRGKGIGKALMSKVAQLGLAAGCQQLNFTVLNWNKSSLDFYLSQGCTDTTVETGYHYMCCKGEALEHLAQP